MILLLAALFSAHITLSDVKDPLTVTLEVNHPKDTHLDTANLSEKLTTNLFNTPPPFKLIREDLNTLTFTLSPQLEGRHPITFYDLTFVSDTGKETQIASPLLFVDIPPKTAKSHMRELRGAILLFLPILYIGLSTLMLMSFYTPPPLTEEQLKAREKQRAIKTLNTLTPQVSSRTLAQTLSHLTRKCLTLPFADTTEEILAKRQDPNLTHILQTADLVTFAGAELTSNEKQALIDETKKVIKT